MFVLIKLVKQLSGRKKEEPTIPPLTIPTTVEVDTRKCCGVGHIRNSFLRRLRERLRKINQGLFKPRKCMYVSLLAFDYETIPQVNKFATFLHQLEFLIILH